MTITLQPNLSARRLGRSLISAQQIKVRTIVGIPISCVISTKNEEVAISRCIRALSDFDEVIVVDSHSTDQTVARATHAGATIVNFSWDGNYPKKKQWILENVPTQASWILFVDADETPTSQLVSEIRNLTASGGLESLAACDLKLDYYFSGRLLRHGHRVTKRSLVHRHRVQFPNMGDLDAPGMGELEGHYQPIANGPVYALKSKLQHQDPDPISSWIKRHNKYSDWEAYLRRNPELRLAIRRRRSRQGRLFDATPGKPLLFFLYTYVVRLGFLDGRPGLDYAVALSFYYWMTNVKTREPREVSTPT